MTTSLKALRAHLNELTGRNTRKMERAELERGIATALAHQDREMARRVDEEIAAAERATRVAARSDFDNWVATDKSSEARLARFITDAITSARAQVEKFTNNLSMNPSYAFDWSGEAFNAAAVIEVHAELLNAFRNGATLDDIRSTLTDRVMSAARSPARSTSPTSNLMSQCRASAEANILDKMRWHSIIG